MVDWLVGKRVGVADGSTKYTRTLRKDKYGSYFVKIKGREQRVKMKFFAPKGRSWFWFK